MAKRKPMSKKLRFEVFKRDRFTCQYCGEKAPDVVLHVDHVKPVADGGGNDILNLVTACAACNGGKGARRLDDRSVVEKQRAQIEELQARREQLELMLRWRDEAEEAKINVVAAIVDRIAERTPGYVPNENGQLSIRKWLKRYDVAEILAALDESFDQHLVFRGDEMVTQSWETAFAKIPILASYRRLSEVKPYMQRLAYIQGILRRRAGEPKMRCMAALEEYHVERNVPVDVLEEEAKRSGDWEDFCDRLNSWRDQLGTD